LPNPVSSAALPYESVKIEHPSKPRGKIYLQASVMAPDMAYGIMVGYRKKNIGGYAAFRSNYVSSPNDYTCDSAGNISSGGVMWPSGQEKKSNFHLSAGMLFRTTDWLDLYAGVGYGSRRLAWEDVAGDWALVADWSHSGFAPELGAIVSWRKLSFSVGVSTIVFKTSLFTCGVGVRL
jgi:opacity protein-like surface antigen